jgi:hypothetical protein
VTTYARDAEGRVLEAVTHREAEWDSEQVALVIAHMRAKKQPRGSHGHLLSEATDPALDPSKAGGSRVEVVGPTIDYFTQALNRAQKQYYDKYPDAPRDERLWSVRRVDPESPAAE